MRYEIINPSDPYTIDDATGDFESVAAAVLCLGRGMYGLRDERGETVLPPMAFATDEHRSEWWSKRFGRSLEATLVDGGVRARMAMALDSVMIGSNAERARMERVLAVIADPAERARAEAAWHDERRSSLNDIGRAAKEWTARLRAKRGAT